MLDAINVIAFITIIIIFLLFTKPIFTRVGASQVAPVEKNPPACAGDLRDAGLIPGPGRSPGEETGNPLQYSCLENPMDRGAGSATVHGVSRSWR